VITTGEQLIQALERGGTLNLAPELREAVDAALAAQAADQFDQEDDEDEMMRRNAISGPTRDMSVESAFAALGTNDDRPPAHSSANAVAGTGGDSTSDAIPREEPYNEQANQRWCAGRGMLALKDFVAEHGTVVAEWPQSIDKSPVTEYTRRVLLLQRASRNFIIDYSLQQGAGSEAAALIRSTTETGYSG